jgi:Flp pilus assembly protein TadB
MMDRAPRDEPDPFLDWKLRIFFAGAVLLMAGVLLDRRVLALLAAVVLGAGLILALVIRLRERRRQDERIAHFAEHDES